MSEVQREFLCEEVKKGHRLIFKWATCSELPPQQEVAMLKLIRWGTSDTEVYENQPKGRTVEEQK